MEMTSFEKQNDHQNVEYGGFWIRVGASIIDSFIVGIPLAIIYFLFITVSFGSLMVLADPYAVEGDINDAQVASLLLGLLIFMLISLVISVGYYAGMNASKWQATVGKKLLGLKVTDVNGNRISFGRSLGRYLAMTFLSPILYIGFIMVGLTEKKQGLHDMIANTLVVKS